MSTDLAEWRQEFDKKAHTVHKVFSTQDGEKVMKLLADSFGAGNVFDENPYKMARNAGQHELVEYLKILIERGSKQ